MPYCIIVCLPLNHKYYFLKILIWCGVIALYHKKKLNHKYPSILMNTKRWRCIVCVQISRYPTMSTSAVHVLGTTPTMSSDTTVISACDHLIMCICLEGTWTERHVRVQQGASEIGLKGRIWGVGAGDIHTYVHSSLCPPLENQNLCIGHSHTMVKLIRLG